MTLRRSSQLTSDKGRAEVRSAFRRGTGWSSSFDQIGLLRFCDRVVQRLILGRVLYCTTVGRFGLKGLFELQLVLGLWTSAGAHPLSIRYTKTSGRHNRARALRWSQSHLQFLKKNPYSCMELAKHKNLCYVYQSR